MPTNNKKLRLGDMLIEHNLITEDQLQTALEEQKTNGLKLGATLVHLEMVSEDQLLSFLARQLRIPFLDLDRAKIDINVSQQLVESTARKLRVVLLGINSTEAFVGMSDPTYVPAVDELSRLLNRSIRCAVVRESDLLRLLNKIYANNDISSLVEKLDEQISEDSISLDDILQSSDAEETPVLKLLKSLFENAVSEGASDVHIEPDEAVLRVRLRIDGRLQEKIINEWRITPALVQRLKLLAQLDISEKRLPQDGRFNIEVKRHKLDVRLSTMPNQYGESVVMRLLDTTAGIPSLEKAGMMPDTLASWRALSKNPHGILLVTGPTGSGKSTTLYSTLHELNDSETKIITVEDPVEYRINRIQQVQVNNKIGLNFSRVLRTALRQDPDVILIGEMRDLETAEIGLRAAMTGHLVLSTLHTNSAADTIARLMDMGAPGFLIASTILGVIGQRLIRRNCDHCAKPTALTDQQRIWVSGMMPHKKDAQDSEFKLGLGCGRCNHSGYSGRIGVYELLTITPTLASAIRNNDQELFYKKVQEDENYIQLIDRAMEFASQGITSIEEVIRLGGDKNFDTD